MGSGSLQTVFRGGDGEPMVLIHGFSGTRHLWDPVPAELERSFDLLAVSLAGHIGGCELGATPASVTALVDAVERDLDDAGFDKAHLVGNSLGGWVAFELAIRGRARSVVAISPAGGWEAGSRNERRLRRLLGRLHRTSTAVVPWVDSMSAGPACGTRRCAMWSLTGNACRRPPPRWSAIRPPALSTSS